MPNIHELLKKDVVYNWSTESQREFNEIKEDISGRIRLKHFVWGWKTKLYINYLVLIKGLVLAQCDPTNSNKKRLI